MERGLVKIGKLTRLHGIKGALLLHTDGAAYPDIQKARTFFVEINGVPTPFFVSEIKILGKNLVLAFDTVKTTGEAQKLVGKEAWLGIAALAGTVDAGVNGVAIGHFFEKGEYIL